MLSEILKHKCLDVNRNYWVPLMYRYFHTTPIQNRGSVAAKYKPTANKSRMLTYEMANYPWFIHHRKAWNSWNTSNVKDGLRKSETAIEDMFIRRFMNGTWHNLFASEVIIKRNHNIIRIVGIVTRTIDPRKYYFLIGYTEELLGYWLQCPIRIELQTVESKTDCAFRYI